jgi:hypothetical protein
MVVARSSSPVTRGHCFPPLWPWKRAPLQSQLYSGSYSCWGCRCGGGEAGETLTLSHSLLHSPNITREGSSLSAHGRLLVVQGLTIRSRLLEALASTQIQAVWDSYRSSLRFCAYITALSRLHTPTAGGGTAILHTRRTDGRPVK